MWALIPLKDFNSAKQRLRPVLGDLCPALAKAMLMDVLNALSLSSRIKRIAIVTSSRNVGLLGELFKQHNVFCIESDGGNLNADLELALQHIQGRLLIVPADLPLLSASNIDALQTQITAADNPEVLIAACKRGTGTNLLSFHSDQPIPPGFGEHSFQRHIQYCQQAGVKAVHYPSPDPTVNRNQDWGFTLDMDEPEDLQQFLFIAEAQQQAWQLHTYRLLKPLAETGALSLEWQPPSEQQILRIAGTMAVNEQPLDNQNLLELCRSAAFLRDRGSANRISFSRKVFIPLTRLCRDLCHYCTFATSPKNLDKAFLSIDEVVDIARSGKQAGCQEALFTLGEKPELRYPQAMQALTSMGYSTTLEYVEAAAHTVLKETGLLPHINAGCMEPEDIRRLRGVSASMGLMLETASTRLCEKGQVHYGSPDKQPAARLTTIKAAGKAQVPFTTGILIGIGETRRERIDSLLAIRQLHQTYGHIQEIIIQNFVPKADTKMHNRPAPPASELIWTIAMARIIFGPEMNIQAPPNLNSGRLQALIGAGINDWGGVSPVTPDHVNPESPWPHLHELATQTEAAGKTLVPRLTIYPSYLTQGRLNNTSVWLDAQVKPAVLALADTEGYAREDSWMPGISTDIPKWVRGLSKASSTQNRPRSKSSTSKSAIVKPSEITSLLARLQNPNASPPKSADIQLLFSARATDFQAVCQAADEQREALSGNTVSYVVNRNINYTNICTYHCHFCAFSKNKKAAGDAPYLKSPSEIAELALEAWQQGATEVCLQGGIHPEFTGQTYLDICRAVRLAVPEIHIHGFSPLEISHGAQTLGISLHEFLAEMKHTGLNTLPGTAAEILHDDVRAILCPDKISGDQWLDVIATAHQLAIPTTATMMFGHVDDSSHWAHHLLKIHDLQQRTGGITEFVPLAFVASEAPIYKRGQSRAGPTFRESVLVHAIARLVFAEQIPNIQTSWVKMGTQGAAFCLQAGANDLGGTLMNESITRAAGAKHGQHVEAADMQEIASAIGRRALQRNTLYKPLSGAQTADAQMADLMNPASLDFEVKQGLQKIIRLTEIRA